MLSLVFNFRPGLWATARRSQHAAGPALHGPGGFRCFGPHLKPL